VRAKAETRDVAVGVLTRWGRQTEKRVNILRTVHGTEFLGVLKL
jgi:hypothetical protein